MTHWAAEVRSTGVVIGAGGTGESDLRENASAGQNIYSEDLN